MKEKQKFNIGSLKNIIVFVLIVVCSVLSCSILIKFANVNNDDVITTETTKIKTSDTFTGLSKGLRCIYDETMSFDAGVGGLKIYFPTQKGYVNYNFVHSKDYNRNCDVWRLSLVFLVDDNGNVVKQITNNGAEWEMAVMIIGRSDYIGGYAHGDENYTSLMFSIDDVQTDITSINKYTSFEELKIVEKSNGYDPLDCVTKALEHTKEYTINKKGITINQKVKWFNEYTLGRSYMSMMPPLKYSLTDKNDIITDKYYTDKKQVATNFSYGEELQDVNKLCVYGSQSGIYFSMTKSNYNPKYNSGNVAIISDNNGVNYNKMYFVFINGENVNKGDIWTSTTNYNIDWKNV